MVKLMLIELSKARKVKEYKPGLVITVNNKIQKDYSYVLTELYGFAGFPADFCPEVSPDRMLELGVFEGKYINDCTSEYPKEWYEKAIKANSLSENPDVQRNCFRIKSRQSLKVWQRNGWIYGYDLRGWFEWYCRFFLGRRDSEIDKIQIGRWKAFRRHVSQVEKNCIPSDIECRPRQRQALLQWAYNPFV